MAFFSRTPASNQPQPSSEEPKRSKRLVFWLFSPLLIIIPAGYAWWAFHQPAVGTVTVQQPAAQAVETTQWKRFAGKYLEFQYADRYREKKHETGQSPFVERVFLMTEETAGRKIAITVEERPEGFGGSANYHLRETYPKQYERHTLDRGGQTGYWFENKQAKGYERVAFLRHKTLVVDIAWSGGGGWDERLQSEWEKMLDSIVWAAL